MSQQPPSIRVRGQDFPQGLTTAEEVERLGQILNPVLRSLSVLSANGVSLTDNGFVEIQSATFAHGVAQQFTMKRLPSAKGCVVLGCDSAIVQGILLQPVVDARPNAMPRAQVTIWFNDSTVTSAKVALLFTPEGQLGTSAPTFLEAIAKSLLTAAGDMIYASAAKTPARLPAGAAGQLLQSAGAAAPVWAGEQAWTGFSFGPNWSNIGGAFEVGAFRKDADSTIHVRGFPIYGLAAGGAGITIATLPIGYRPLKTQDFACPNFNGAGYQYGQVRFNNDGTIQTQLFTNGGAGTSGLVLNGITFDGR